MRSAALASGCGLVPLPPGRSTVQVHHRLGAHPARAPVSLAPQQRSDAPHLVLLPPARCEPARARVLQTEEEPRRAASGQPEQAPATQQQQLPSPDMQRLSEEREDLQPELGAPASLTARRATQQESLPQGPAAAAAGPEAEGPPPPYVSIFQRRAGEDTPAYVLRLSGRFGARLAQRWSKLEPQTLATSMLFVLGVILVNYGVESMLDFYLGESPVGSIGCILMGAGVLTYLRLMRVPVARALLQVFLN